MSHDQLHALNDWCKTTGLLYPWVSFYSDRCEWTVRIVAPTRGQHKPLRTIHGSDLEAVCAEILPKAQKIFEQERPSLEREASAAKKRNSYNWKHERREIEAMHHSAEDF